jgi:hypothetical protein
MRIAMACLLLLGCGGSGGGGGGGTEYMGVVVNEIRAGCPDTEPDCDFAELFNAGPAAVDLSGFELTDGLGDGEVLPADPTTVRPRRGNAVVVPDGTVLGPGAYLLLRVSLEAMAEPGFSTNCFIGGPPMCLHAPWGFSGIDGDVFFLIEPGGDIAIRAPIPPGAVPDTRSLARLPNGTGELADAAPTPGAENLP